MNWIIGFILITSLLASGHGDSVLCGVKKRFAQLSDNYIVYFTTCYDPNAPLGCHCPDSQNITDAWFWRDGKKQNLKHNSSSFWITSSELHIHHGGRYWFRFEYSYHCSLLTSCKQGGIKLELQVANFSLRFLNASSKEHARGSDVWLLCSSHLNDSRTVEVRFHFKSLDNKTFNASCLANQSKTISYGHWLVHRNRETHDCILEIRNVNNKTDAGEYRCNGLLPVNGRIEYDMSNPENLTVYHNESSSSSAKPFERGSIIGIAIGIGFTMLLLLVASIRLCFINCRPDPNPNPNPNPDPNPDPIPDPNPDPDPDPQSSQRGGISSAAGGSQQSERQHLLPRGTTQEGSSASGGAQKGKSGAASPQMTATKYGTQGAQEKTESQTGHGLAEGSSIKPKKSSSKGTSCPIPPSQDLAHFSSNSDESSTKDSSSGKTSSTEISPPISLSEDPALQSFTLNEESSNKDSGSESPDSSKENCHGSFTTEVAVEYVQSQNEPPPHTPESDAPFDDNLQCRKCGRKYREGQIQHFRQHMETCQGN